MTIVSYNFVSHSENLEANQEKHPDYRLTSPLTELETLLFTKEIKSLSAMGKLQTSLCTIADLDSKTSGLGLLFPGENKPQSFGLSIEVIKALSESGYDRVTKVIGLVNNVNLHSTKERKSIPVKLEKHLTEIFQFVATIEKIFSSEKK